jgi:peroxiredoxin
MDLRNPGIVPHHITWHQKSQDLDLNCITSHTSALSVIPSINTVKFCSCRTLLKELKIALQTHDVLGSDIEKSRSIPFPALLTTIQECELL